MINFKGGLWVPYHKISEIEILMGHLHLEIWSSGHATNVAFEIQIDN